MIKIPCTSCGCQNFEASNKFGKILKIEICKCNDGSGEFEISIKPNDDTPTYYEKHQCSENDIEQYLTSRFKLNLDTMNHHCF